MKYKMDQELKQLFAEGTKLQWYLQILIKKQNRN